MRSGGLPTARAAAMQSSTLTLGTRARVSLANTGVVETLVAIIALVKLGPRKAARAIAQIRNGQARKVSLRGRSTASPRARASCSAAALKRIGANNAASSARRRPDAPRRHGCRRRLRSTAKPN